VTKAFQALKALKLKFIKIQKALKFTNNFILPLGVLLNRTKIF